ncbi:MAG TPA: hypothetical protein VMF67_08360 [Rhizomicrobium sp.]|nr:hypothetical protein [Rhizomicrobium sp.]
MDVNGVLLAIVLLVLVLLYFLPGVTSAARQPCPESSSWTA